MKKTIPAILLLMVVGFAAVSTSLFINGNTNVSKSDDFYVYFSDAKANGIRDLSLVESETKLVFETTLTKLGENYILDYDVTNSSKNYDARISINCLGENEYLEVENTFDTNSLLEARETRSGSLQLSLKKSKLGDELKVSVSCTLDVTAEERTSLGEGDVADPVGPLVLKPGDILTIGGEDFYFVKEENKKLTILAVDSLGNNNLQTSSNTLQEYGIPFGPQLGWEYTPGPKEINLNEWAPTIKAKLDDYASFIGNELNDETVTADLMTVKELDELGCSVSLDYAYHGGESCKNSENASWLLNDQYWWTKSASTDVKRVWVVFPESVDGYVSDIEYPNSHGVRPKLVISKGAYTFYLATNNN